VPGVLLVTGATVTAESAAPPGPCRDYLALARALDAEVLDRAAVGRSPVGRLLARACGVPAAQAWLAFAQRSRHEVIVTDGEHVGIPLALLLKLARDRSVHVTIGHRLSSRKKRPFFRLLNVQSHIARIVVHSTLQLELAAHELRIEPKRLALLPYHVDTDFWRPSSTPPERLIVSAGLEHRDYPTLFRAVDGLDARVVIGAASHWSRRPNSAHACRPPPNVEIGAFDYVALRALYDRAAVVVVPLVDVDFQAGVTTILEAMAMGTPVVASQTRGQTDMVVDRRAVLRGAPTSVRSASLLQQMSDGDGARLEPTGFYVPPGDAVTLRRALRYLLDHPVERAELGAAGRRVAAQLLTTAQFAERVAAVVRKARAAQACQEGVAAAPLRPGVDQRRD